MHYQCIDKVCKSNPLPKPCESGGYQDPKNCNVCRCPPGTGGTYCADLAQSSGPVRCGGTIIVPPCSSVKITSPNYPGKYPLDSSCSWLVKSGSGIVLAFDKKPGMPAKPCNFTH